MRTWRIRKEILGVLGEYAKRHKNVYISVNNNTNLKKIYILAIYNIWDGLSLKTISRYCPFKSNFPRSTMVNFMLLICGTGLNLEKAETAARVACISDLFIHLVIPFPAAGRKRKHSDSDTGDGTSGGSRA
jgi:hypothetical protein